MIVGYALFNSVGLTVYKDDKIEIYTNVIASKQKNDRRVFIETSGFGVYRRDYRFDRKILTNKSIRNNTIVIYTAITNEFTKIQNEAKDEFGFGSFYNKAPSLFNARAIEFFYEFLAKHGIDEVTYYEVRDNFTKHYGYFRINK